MPSTVYKGDLSEVTFGRESGLYLASANSAGHASGYPQTFTWTSAAVANTNTSTITFAGGISNSPVQSTKLMYPEGMLIGATLTFHGTAGNHADDDYAATGQLFTIVKHTASSGATVLTVSPTLKSTGAVSNTGDAFYIHSLGTPASDVTMAHNTSASTSDESVLTDQFIGLAATVTLPDIKNTIERQHVVGIGRDVVVQVAGKQTTEGGTIEVMMNNPRWLYYGLGGTSVKDTSTGAVVSPTLDGAVSAGDSHVTLSALTSIAVCDYLMIEDTAPYQTPSDNPAVSGTGSGGNTWPDSTHASGFKFIETNEVRRIVALNGSNSSASKVVWLDAPLDFGHATGRTCRIMRYDTASSNGSPDVNKDTLAITNPYTHLMYASWNVPSFTLEHSIRNRDVGGYHTETGALENVPGTSSDAKSLTRVFRGCKVKDWSLTADADAQVKFTANFDALSVYTDTGRLESSAKGDRYTAHRMFENTANSVVNRKIAGIAPYTQKPYLFYNGTIKAFGQTIARATKFTLNGKNNVAQHWVISGTDAPLYSTSVTGEAQVPFAGSRLPKLAVEGKTEYDLELEIIIDDPLLWHELRNATERDWTAPVELTLTKQGTGATRESIIITVEDYIMETGPIPVPEDKGVIRTAAKLFCKHVKVETTGTLIGL